MGWSWWVWLMEGGPGKVPQVAPAVGPMGVGAPLVGRLNMEVVVKDTPVVEDLMAVGHKGTPLVVDHMEEVHLMDQEMVVVTVPEVPKGVANSHP